MAQHKKNAQQNEDGFVLIAVLLVVLLLAASAATFTQTVRGHLRVVASATAISEAEALADAGANLAIMDLMAMRGSSTERSRFPVNGTPASCRFDASGADTVTIEVRDEAGKINLNSQSVLLIEALFAGLGSSADEARTLAARIQDFRDPDSDPREFGAEQDDYNAMPGRLAGPKNRPFDAVEELEQVLGMPTGILARARAYLTVQSGTDGFDPGSAPAGLTDVINAGLIALGEATLTESDAAAGLYAKPTQKALEIRASARTGSRGLFVREAIVELAQGETTAMRIRRWRQGASPGPVAGLGPTLPSCEAQ